MNVVDPRRMETREWVDRTASNLSAFVPVMKLDTGDQWVEWGNHVRQVLKVRGILTPLPEQFPEFEEWAFRFNQVIAPI